MNSTVKTLALIATSALLATAVHAQTTYPSKPIRIVVPFGAGGVADLTVRAVAQKMSDALGQPIVIDNKPSAGGIVGDRNQTLGRDYEPREN